MRLSLWLLVFTLLLSVSAAQAQDEDPNVEQISTRPEAHDDDTSTDVEDEADESSSLRDEDAGLDDEVSESGDSGFLGEDVDWESIPSIDKEESSNESNNEGEGELARDDAAAEEPSSEAMDNFFRDFIDFGEDDLEGFEDDLSDGLEGFEDDLSDGLEDFEDDLSDGLEDFEDDLSDGLEDFEDDLSDGLEDLEDDLGDGLEGLSDGLGEVLGNFDAGFGGGFDNTNEDIGKGSEDEHRSSDDDPFGDFSGSDGDSGLTDPPILKANSEAIPSDSLWDEYGGVRPVRMLQAPQSSATASDSAKLEYDDASVDESAIPSGYFPQQPSRNGRRGARLQPDSISFPGFQLPISPGYSSKAWWQYDVNVCVTKKRLRQRRRSRRVGGWYTQHSIRCGQRNSTHYMCRLNTANSSSITTFLVTYTCCSGFTRLPLDRGCPRALDPSRNRTLAELLQQLGYESGQVRLFNWTLGAGGRGSRRWTVFVPQKEALKRFAEPVLSAHNASRLPRRFVQSMLNHVSPGARHSRSFTTGQRLRTSAAGGGGLLLTSNGRQQLVNCVPVLRADLPFDNFSFVHVTQRVLPAPNATVYGVVRQLLLHTWRISSTKAAAILSQLKKALNNRRSMVTVFVHRPTELELRSGCYARNILAATASGVHCSQTLTHGRRLRPISGGSCFGTWAEGNSTSLLAGRGAKVTEADILATNGLLHVVNISLVSPVLENPAYQQLQAAAEFRTSVFSPNASNVTFLLTPESAAAAGSWRNSNSSSSNSNSSSSNSSSSLVAFGRRHLSTGRVGADGRLRMLDGARRLVRSVLAVSPSGRRRRIFVDCVPVSKTVRNCDGSTFVLLQAELPQFNQSLRLSEFLSSNTNYSSNAGLVSFMIDYMSSFRRQVDIRDLSITLLPNGDFNRLTRGVMRRRLGRREMMQLANWYWRYFVRSKDQCPLRRRSAMRVSVFPPRRCHSLLCSFLSYNRAAVVLTEDSATPLREGFALFARLRQ